MSLKSYGDGVMEVMVLVQRILRVNFKRRKEIRLTRNGIREHLNRFRDECKEEARKWKKRYYELKEKCQCQK